VRRLLLVRHAQSEWNAAGRWQGVADPALSLEGRDQAAEAGVTLARLVAEGDLASPVAALVASDLGRAVATAAIIGEAVGWPRPPTVVAGLREHDVGEWSGLTRPEIDARWPGMVEAWSTDPEACPPGGERRSAFDARVRAALDTLADGSAPGLTVAVTHGGVLRSVARCFGVTDHPPGNLDGVVLDVDADGLPGWRGTIRLLSGRAPAAGRSGATIP
jgi:broad specificity phosphatase PhoE